MADNQALERGEQIETVLVSALEFGSEPEPVNPVPETVPEGGDLVPEDVRKVHIVLVTYMYSTAVPKDLP